MDKFRIIIASLPDRERPVAEIAYENVQWVEISQETDEIINPVVLKNAKTFEEIPELSNKLIKAKELNAYELDFILLEGTIATILDLFVKKASRDTLDEFGELDFSAPCYQNKYCWPESDAVPCIILGDEVDKLV